MSYIRRLIPIEETLKTKSVLLLGPRRTGKSTYLKHRLKADRSYDLLKSEVFRERLNERDRLVVIDEIQKLPQLMDEVHSLIEDRVIVCREREVRRVGKVEIMPWRVFAESLWGGELILG